MDTSSVKGGRKKYLFVIVMLLAILVIGSLLTALYARYDAKNQTGEDKLNVVTSFYPMYIATMNIIEGDDGVNLKNLSEPKTGCLHDYQLTSDDMKLLSGADVFVVNGGGIENFLSDVAAEYPDLVIIEACEGIELDEDNPHVWMDPSLYQKQVENIKNGLAGFNPDSSDIYENNAKAYEAKVEELANEADEIAGAKGGSSVVAFQESFEYIAGACGYDVSFVLDLDEERQGSAGEVADVMAALSKMENPVVITDELYGSDMANTVKNQLPQAKIIYIDPLVTGDYYLDAYIEKMSENLEKLR